MERLKPLLARYAQTAFLVFMGLILIVYLGMGFLYLQQDPQQKDYQDKTDKLTAILRSPIPSFTELQAAYDNVMGSLTPLADNVTIALLVGVAKAHGIDVSEESGKFQVPVPSHSAGAYRITSFKGVHVEGSFDNVTALISVLDSNKPLLIPGSNGPSTVVRAVTRLSTQDVTVVKEG